MNINLSFFVSLVSLHESRYSTSPYFIKDNDDLVQTYLEEGFCEEYFEAKEYFEEVSSQNISFIVSNNWQVNYEILDNVWIFRRTLSEYESERYFHANTNLLNHQIKENIYQLTPNQFEDLIFDIFSALEPYYHPIRRTQTRDGGYEFTVRYDDPITNSYDRICVQVKHEKSTVSISHVRGLIGVLDTIQNKPGRNRSRGIIVSLKDPSKDAAECASKSSKSVDFLSLERIIELMIENQIGCKNIFTNQHIDFNYWKNIGGVISCQI